MRCGVERQVSKSVGKTDLRKYVFCLVNGRIIYEETRYAVCRDMAGRCYIC